MQLFKSFFLNQADLAESRVAVIELLLERLPRSPMAEVSARLEAQGTNGPVVCDVEQDWATHDLLLARLSFGGHSVEVAGIPSPLPPEPLERSVDLAPWGGGFRQFCRSHAAHLILRYSGAITDGIEQYLALYQVAAALTDPTAPGSPLLAVVNEPAWTAHPAPIVAQLTQPAMADTIRQSPPLPFWTGLLPLETEADHLVGAGAERLYLTRGYHLFGLPDLALQGYGPTQAAEAQHLLHDLFHYFYFENRDVRPGDFLTLAEQGYLAFADGADYRTLFGGVADILVVRPSSADELAAVETDEPNSPPQ